MVQSFPPMQWVLCPQGLDLPAYALSYTVVIRNSSLQCQQTGLPLKLVKSPGKPQIRQTGLYFRKTMVSPSTKISTGSFSLIPNVRRHSIGNTIRPSGSVLRTKRVAFIWNIPPQEESCHISLEWSISLSKT
jgi:hypothetical protein